MNAYDVFISYRHDRDKWIAAKVQRAIQRLGKPWYRRRALRVFRDDTSLSATPKLWSSIEHALSKSRFLILFACPEAAASPWIDREVAYWVEHKGIDTLLIALTGGELAWRGDNIGFPNHSPLPPSLQGRHAQEPKFVDLRELHFGSNSRDILELSANFVAAIRGISKEDILSEELRQQRRALALALGATTALALVSASAVWQWQQAEVAKRAAQRETARAEKQLRETLTTQSLFLGNIAREYRLANDPGSALLIALEALPDRSLGNDRPYVADAEGQLNYALQDLREEVVLPHTEELTSASFSRDGRRVVTASGRFFLSRRQANANSNAVWQWDAKTGRQIGKPLNGHGSPVFSAAFSADGQRIVSASGRDHQTKPSATDDNTVRIWDALRGEPIGAPLRGHADAVLSAEFSPDGKLVVSASADETARVWNAITGQPVGPVLRGHTSYVLSASFSPDGTRVVTASSDSTAIIWKVPGGQRIGGPLKGHTEPITRAFFSQDGERILTASLDGTVRQWNASSGQPVGEPLVTGLKRLMSISADGKVAIGATESGTLQAWDATTRQSLGKPFNGHLYAASSAGFSPDGRQIVTASSDGTARIWSVNARTPSGTVLRGHGGAVNSARYSGDGRRIATTSADKSIRVWDASTGQQIGQPLLWHKQQPHGAMFGPGGQSLLSVGDGEAVLWNLKEGRVVRAYPGDAAALSPNGNHIVTATWGGVARLWTPDSSHPTSRELKWLGTPVKSVSFSPDSRRVAIGEWSGLRIWDVRTGEPVGEAFKSSRPLIMNDVLADAAFSPDGSRIVIVAENGTIRLWSTHTGHEIVPPFGPFSIGNWKVFFSPDGRRIVTAGNGGVWIWDAGSGRQVGSMPESRGQEVKSAAFNSVGDHLLVALQDSTARIIPIDANTQALVERAKAASPRCLTAAQRQAAFLPPAPPAWCIEMAKWPYDQPSWKQWLSDWRSDPNTPLPMQAGPEEP